MNLGDTFLHYHLFKIKVTCSNNFYNYVVLRLSTNYNVCLTTPESTFDTLRGIKLFSFSPHTIPIYPMGPGGIYLGNAYCAVY